MIAVGIAVLQVGEDVKLFALFTIIAPSLAYWNASHIYNPAWPPHAKFHNAQTMAMAVLLGTVILLGTVTLFCTWKSDAARSNVAPALLFASLYWISRVLAFTFPGVARTDSDLLQAGQSLSDFPIQLKGDVVLLPVIFLALAGWLGMAKPAVP